MKELQPLKQREKLFTDFYVFDTETRGLRAKSDAFIFGVIFGHNFIKVLYSVDEFKKEFQDEKYYHKKVYAHNAEYDLNVIYDNIYELDRKAIFNGKFICCTNGNCTFADSMNIYPASVKEIGHISGLEKMELDEGFKQGTYTGIVKQTDIDYCIRDCEIIYNALYSIFSLVGSIKITLAGLSLDYFRRKFLKEKIVYNEYLCKYFFESYFGGRTEAFFIGKTNAICFDVNSMYPFAMKYCNFPNPKTLKIVPFCDAKVLVEKYLKYYEGVAHVKLFHETNYFGFLPLKKNGKLLFPCGTFDGWYNFNELRFAIENNVIKIINVKEVIFSEGILSPFIEFVDHNFRVKQESKDPLEIRQVKLLLNALYGKFAQRIKSEMIYIKDIEIQIGLIEEYEQKKQLIKIIPFNAERLDCFIEVKSNKGFLYNTIPVFSSYITSFARIELLKYMIKYKENNPLYCDTDSIFFETLPAIKESNELGKFKRENKLVTEIRGLKNYSYIENNISTDRIKGVPKNAIKTGANMYEYSTLIKTRESVARNQIVGINTKRTKVLSMKYDKRIVEKNGQTKAIIL